MEIISWIMANYQMILANSVLVLSALIAIFMVIPGEQPDKALQSALDFIVKFSKKKD